MLETSHQLCGVEGFAHISVGTVFQAANDIVLIGTAAQDNYWHGLAVAAKVGAQGASIAVRETHVEQYEIEVGRCDRKGVTGCGEGANGGCTVAAMTDLLGQFRGQIGIIFDDKDLKCFHVR